MPPKRATPIAIRGRKTVSPKTGTKAKASARSSGAAPRKSATPRKKSPSPASASSRATVPGRVAKGRTIVAVLMQLQCDVKIFHWQTHGFAAHKMSDELHAVLIEKIDAFVEQYMGGRSDRVNFGARGTTLKLRNVSSADLVKALRAAASFLTKSLPGQISRSDTDLLTLRDDILGALRKAQYLMTLK